MKDDSTTEREARRARRRERLQRRVFDTTIPSPCIAVCQIDNATDCCIGCHRSIDEIREWPIMTAEEKTETLARVARRKEATESDSGPESTGAPARGD